jgi:hypothetical protein
MNTMNGQHQDMLPAGLNKYVMQTFVIYYDLVLFGQVKFTSGST